MNYSQLTSIPLFTGISGDDLALILDRVDLLDLDLTPGETFVRSGDVCQGMAIVREGTMQRHQSYDAGTFTNARHETTPLCYEVTERMKPTYIIEPEILFGLNLQHRNTWRAETTCHLTLIGKNDIRKTLMYVPVWRINFMNMLCTQLQKSMDEGLPKATPSMKERVKRYILRHSSPRGISLEMAITIEQIGYALGFDRRSVAKVVAQLEDEGLLEKQRQKLIISNLELLRANAEIKNE